MIDSQKRALLLEVSLVTIVLVAIASLLFSLQNVTFIGKYHGLIFAILFLYVPVFVLRRRRRGIDFLDRDFSSYLKSIIVFFITSIIVFPLFLLAAHGWMNIVYGAGTPVFKLFPDFWQFVAFQFVMVALPEEFFFRGYVQGSLNKVFAAKWRVLGVNLGWSWIITATVFAVAHSIVTLQWWHFAIFFPALLFGYLRERTGSITTSLLFHGTANVIMNLIANFYA